MRYRLLLSGLAVFFLLASVSVGQEYGSPVFQDPYEGVGAGGFKPEDCSKLPPAEWRDCYCRNCLSRAEHNKTQCLQNCRSTPRGQARVYCENECHRIKDREEISCTNDNVCA